jgi:pimeloyl-ACP methyl ester carboxylesterase
MATLPPGAKPVLDERIAYGRLFCGVLEHTPDGNEPWAPCNKHKYLHLDEPVEAQPTAADDHFLPNRRVMVVGGIFARCARVPVFDDAKQHLEAHGIHLEHVPVFGNGSSEQNAAEIKRYLEQHPGNEPYVVVGHSKGAVDLLEALIHHPEVKARVQALVTVASPVGGSRLVDGVPALLKGLAQEMPEFKGCVLGDGLGAHSLARPTRQRFLRDHVARINQLSSYSIVAVSALKDTSTILHGLWRFLAPYSIVQDSHVIAEEALLPATKLLARANGDHWAVAFPAEQEEALKKGADQNHYPRTALLEAALRMVARDHPH